MATETAQGEQAPSSPRAHARVRCEGTTQAGERCRGKALPGSEFCFYHDPESDLAESSRAGGLTTQARRSVRERFREDAERVYETLFTKLLEAVESEITRWGDCPNCKHRVPVTFPDVRARTQAIQVLLDQGYGKPTERVEVSESASLLEQLQALPPEEREQLRVRAFARYVACLISDARGSERVREAAETELVERVAGLSPEQLELFRGGIRTAVRRELEAVERGGDHPGAEPLALPAPTGA